MTRFFVLALTVMKRGVKPTPTVLLPPDSRARYDRAKEPMPIGKLANPPEWLQGDGRTIWFALAPKLIAMGVGTDVDEDAFARYCMSYSIWIGLSVVIAKDGASETIYTENGSKTQRSGAFLAYIDLTRQIERMECKFGLTPSDRVGLGKTQGKNDGNHGNSKRAELLNRKKNS